MQLSDFFDYKNKLMEEILTDEEIVHILDETLPFAQSTQLAYKQVFPAEYVPETITDGMTYICFDVDIQKSSGKTFYVPVLYIWVFAHRSHLRLPNGGICYDKICSLLCEKLNGSRQYSLGELELYSVKRFAPMTDYQGKVMTFVGKEFSKIYDPNKYTPSKRK